MRWIQGIDRESAAHHSAVGAAVDGGILQGCQGIEDAVVAVRHPQESAGEFILAPHHRTLHHALHVNVTPCDAASVEDDV